MLIWVTISAVSTVHNGSGKAALCAIPSPPRRHRHAQCQQAAPDFTHPGAQPAAENFYMIHGP
jgi:hypothetical protein